MEKVVLDAATRARFGPLVSQVALADESGHTFAYALPPDLYHRLTAGEADVEPTPEEREAARDEYRRSGGLTTAEAIALVRGGAAGRRDELPRGLATDRAQPGGPGVHRVA